MLKRTHFDQTKEKTEQSNKTKETNVKPQDHRRNTDGNPLCPSYQKVRTTEWRMENFSQNQTVPLHYQNQDQFSHETPARNPLSVKLK